MPETKRRTRRYRGYRITVLRQGRGWVGIVYAPDSSIVAQDVPGDTSHLAIAACMAIVNECLRT